MQMQILWVLCSIIWYATIDVKLNYVGTYESDYIGFIRAA